MVFAATPSPKPAVIGKYLEYDDGGQQVTPGAPQDSASGGERATIVAKQSFGGATIRTLATTESQSSSQVAEHVLSEIDSDDLDLLNMTSTTQATQWRSSVESGEPNMGYDNARHTGNRPDNGDDTTRGSISLSHHRISLGDIAKRSDMRKVASKQHSEQMYLPRSLRSSEGSVNGKTRRRRRRRRSSNSRPSSRGRERTTIHHGDSSDSITSLSDTDGGDDDDDITTTSEQRFAVAAALATTYKAAELAKTGMPLSTPNRNGSRRTTSRLKEHEMTTPVAENLVHASRIRGKTLADNFSSSVELDHRTTELHNIRNAIKRLDGKINTSPYLKNRKKAVNKEEGREHEDSHSITKSNEDSLQPRPLKTDNAIGLGVEPEREENVMKGTTETEERDWGAPRIKLSVSEEQRQSDSDITSGSDYDGTGMEFQNSKLIRTFKDHEAIIAALKGDLEVSKAREKSLVVSYNNETMLVAQTTDQLQIARKECEESKQTIQQLIERNNELTQQLNDAEVSFENASATKSESSPRESELELEIRRLKQQNQEIRESKQEYENLVRDIKKNEKSLMIRLEEMQERVAAFEGERQRQLELEEQVTRTTRHGEELLQSIRQERERVSSLEYEKEHLQSQLSLKKTELEDVSSQLEKLHSESKHSKKLAEDKLQLENQVNQWSSREQELLMQLKDSQKKINKLTEINSSRWNVVEQEYEKKLHHMRKINKDLEETCRQLKNKQQIIYERNQQALSKERTLNEKVEEQNEKIQTLTKKNASLFEENAAFKERAREQAKEFENFDDEFQAIKSRYTGFLKKYDVLLRAHNEAKALLKRKDDKLYQYAEKIKRLKSEKMSIQSQLELLRGENDMPQQDDLPWEGDHKKRAKIVEKQSQRSRSRRRSRHGRENGLVDEREKDSNQSEWRVMNGTTRAEPSLGHIPDDYDGNYEQCRTVSKGKLKFKPGGNHLKGSRGLKLEDIDRLEEENAQQFVRNVSSSRCASSQQHHDQRIFEGASNDRVALDYEARHGTRIPEKNGQRRESVRRERCVSDRKEEQLQELEQEFSRIENVLESKEREYLRKKLISYRTKLELKNIQLTSLKELMFQYASSRKYRQKL